MMKFVVLAILYAHTAYGSIRIIDEAADCLKIHNEKRSLHRDTPMMTYDQSLVQGAEEWAKKLAISGSLRHSRGTHLGENLYMAGGWGTPANVEKAIDSWYSEISMYDFSNPGYKSGVGHFTQIVWKSSLRVACGVAYNTDTKETYIVARYAPQGNWMNRFATNVMPLGSGGGPVTSAPVTQAPASQPPATDSPVTSGPVITNSPPSGPIRIIDEAADCLKIHNEKRSLHRDTPMMTYDQSLVKGAEEWALKLAKSGNLKHSTGRSYGENLYMAGGWGTPATVEKAIDSWYAEIKSYDFNNPGYRRGVGHFTQIVWKSTMRVACGVAYNSDTKETYIVARYAPPGNMMGNFGTNVMNLSGNGGGNTTLPPSQSCKDTMSNCYKFTKWCGSHKTIDKNCRKTCKHC